VEVKNKPRQNIPMSQLIAVCAIVGAVIGILNFFRAYLSETERLAISLWEATLVSSRRSNSTTSDSRHNSGANCRHQTPIDVPENPHCNPSFVAT
jgi:hypothetical protein